MRALRAAARTRRSDFGRKASSERAPTRSTGGFARSCSSEGMSASPPSRSLRSASTDRSTCSRLRAGSGSRPISRSASDTAAASAARAASGSVSQRDDRRSRDERTWRGSPAVEPGVIRRRCVRSRKARRSASVTPHCRRPSSRSEARLAATSRGVRSSPGASVPSTQGRNGSGENDGNASRRSGRSPFTSMSSVGTWAPSASSTSTVTRPVLPLPVIPTITPCVTR